jgi:hypothetical protein
MAETSVRQEVHAAQHLAQLPGSTGHAAVLGFSVYGGAPGNSE